MQRSKDVLTTGQVAKICNVAPRTVSKWFDSGQLRGYRIPGSKDRRIPVQQLVRFMRAHGIPTDELESGQIRVLIVDNDRDLANVLVNQLTEHGDYDLKQAHSGFEAGVVAEQFRPHVILLEITLRDVDGKEVCRHIQSNPELQGTKVVAMSGALTDGEAQALLQQGFDGFLKKPFDVHQAMSAIEELSVAMC